MSGQVDCFECEGYGYVFVAVCCGCFESDVCCGDNDTEEQPCPRCDGTGIERTETKP